MKKVLTQMTEMRSSGKTTNGQYDLKSQYPVFPTLLPNRKQALSAVATVEKGQSLDVLPTLLKPAMYRDPGAKAEMELQQLLQLYLELVEGPPFKTRFLVKKGQQLMSVPTNQIAYFYSKNKLSFIKTTEGHDLLLNLSIEQIEKSVAPDLFFRVSRKYIVTHAAVNKVLIWFNGKLKLELKPGCDETIIISRERAAGFKVWLGE